MGECVTRSRMVNDGQPWLIMLHHGKDISHGKWCVMEVKSDQLVNEGGGLII